jgi:hypothetical protein
MGMSESGLNLLLQSSKVIPFKGSILQLGRQWVFFSYKYLKTKAKEYNIELKQLNTVNLSHDQNYFKEKFIDDNTLFKSLGFAQVESMDVSISESPTYQWNLNNPIPDYLKNKYDVIMDGGTSEHIYNFPQVLKNIHNMLNENGIIIHAANPINNHVDHGYYSFSPMLFYEYYLVNSYEILHSCILQINKNVNKPWKIYKYKPGMLEKFSYGGFNDSMWALYFVCKKNKNSTCDKIPNQGCSESFLNDKAPIKKDFLNKILTKVFKRKVFPKKTLKL